MKVYFTASQRGKTKFGKYYKIIHDELKRLNYILVEDELFSLSTRKFYENIEAGGVEARRKFYLHNQSYINEADITIYDCSFHSLSIGFVIEKSLELEKPTIILYLKGHNPYYLEGITHDRLVVKEYTPTNLKTKLKEALNESREHRDKRFNFFISPKILAHLEKQSKTLNMTKSTYVRGLLIDDMKKLKT